MKFKKISADIKQTRKLQKEFGFAFAKNYLLYKYTHNTQKYIENAKTVLAPYIDLEQTEVLHNEISSIVPIWVFWWQGEAQMPEVVKVCYLSLKKNLPEKTKLVLLSKDNYKDFTDIPKEITEKVERGIFSITLFSDLLRNELLTKYGGLWIDATIYCAKPIEYDLLHNSSFWSIKLYPDDNDKLSIGRNITNRMWGGFIQKAAPGEVINTKVLAALKKYMIKHNVLAEYFIQNIFIRLLYDSDPLVKKEIDAIPYSNPHLYDLADLINEPFKYDRWENLISDTTFFKLSWKKKYCPRNSNGEETFYGHILQNHNV